MKEHKKWPDPAEQEQNQAGGPPWWLSLCFSIPAIILSVISLLRRG